MMPGLSTFAKPRELTSPERRELDGSRPETDAMQVETPAVGLPEKAEGGRRDGKIVVATDKKLIQNREPNSLEASPFTPEEVERWLISAEP